MLPQASQPRVHAAVVLSEIGRGMLIQAGRRALGRALAGHLAARWDAVLLPRVWRYRRCVAAQRRRASCRSTRSPRSSSRATGTRSLHHESRGRGLARAPARGSRAISSIWTGTTTAQPLVAAVVELRWVMEAAFDLLGRTPRVSEFEVLKFPEVLLPGQRFALRVERSRGRRPPRLPALRRASRVRVGALPADRRARERRVEAVSADSDLRPQGRHRSASSRSLEACGLHCFVIDDGSNAATRAVLDAIEARYPVGRGLPPRAQRRPRRGAQDRLSAGRASGLHATPSSSTPTASTTPPTSSASSLRSRAIPRR